MSQYFGESGWVSKEFPTVDTGEWEEFFGAMLSTSCAPLRTDSECPRFKKELKGHIRSFRNRWISNETYFYTAKNWKGLGVDEQST